MEYFGIICHNFLISDVKVKWIFFSKLWWLEKELFECLMVLTMNIKNYRQIDRNVWRISGHWTNRKAIKNRIKPWRVLNFVGNGNASKSNESAVESNSADGLLWKLIKKALDEGESLRGRRETVRVPLRKGTGKNVL